MIQLNKNDKNYQQFRVRVSLSPFVYTKVFKLNKARGNDTKFANANLVNEILGKVASGELVDRHSGKCFFSCLEDKA